MRICQLSIGSTQKSAAAALLEPGHLRGCGKQVHTGRGRCGGEASAARWFSE